LIAAESLQAKGRIERLWGIFQDRLVKAIREAGASNREEANQVLESCLPKNNQCPTREAAKPDMAYILWANEMRFSKSPYFTM
jgi:hypothetical protein